MEWLKNQIMNYMFRRVGIVFATAVGGYAATLLIRRIQQRLLQTPSLPEGKKKKKKRRRRKHKKIEYEGTSSSLSSSSS